MSDRVVPLPQRGLAIELADPGLLVEQAFIDGKWVGEPVDTVSDPATGRVIARVPRLGAAEAARAVEAAERAFAPWSRLLAKERGRLLRRWFDLVVAAREDLALIMTHEQGKPLAEARGEIDYAASFIEYYAEETKRIFGETIPAHRPDTRVIVAKRPVGVVAAITPWNFPSGTITRKVAPALAAGCTVVVKPAPETPLSALALAVLGQRAGLPPGVFNVVTGDAPAIGRAFTDHPAVRLLTFTGSTEVGRQLMRQCADGVKKLALELGGHAPFIVFDDANLDAAVEGLLSTKYRNNGQTCTSANRIYVQEGIHDAFVAKLARRIADLKVGPGTNPHVTQGPLINLGAVEKVEAQVADALAKGAQVVAGGARHPLGPLFYPPTLLTGVTIDMLVTTEETFGPMGAVYRFATEAEVVAQANASPYGLAAYFYARDLGRAFRVAEALDYGMVGINSVAVGTEVAPFGGVKQSGFGREGSHQGIEEYLELKCMVVADPDA